MSEAHLLTLLIRLFCLISFFVAIRFGVSGRWSDIDWITGLLGFIAFSTYGIWYELREWREEWRNKR